jgi:FAD/FMN-containing dehydrogenase
VFGGAVSRKTFLRASLGAAATLLLDSCRTAPAPATPAPSQPPNPDWAALQETLDGRLVLPSDSRFAAAKGLFNSRFDDSTPAAVVAVASTADVQHALAFAAAAHLPVTARSGGHSYIGASAAGGALVLDLRQLPGGVTVDESAGTATVSAAANLMAVQQALNAHGRAIPTGSCPTVGVAGLTLGGGLGADARRYGLTCDALVSATVVVPSGEMVTTSATEHSDLFWALRGGGADIGIVTSFTFRTFATVDRDVVTLTFPAPVAATVLTGWHRWLQNTERAVWSMVNITVGGRSSRCSVILATPAGDGPGLAAEMTSAIGLQPASSDTRTLNHLDFVDYFSGGAQAVAPRAFVAGSDIIESLTPAAADAIVAATSAWPADVGSATAVVESLDGAVRDVGPTDSAFPWRRHAACVQWYVETPTPAAVDAGTTWLTAAHQAVQANSAGGYVNYLEAGSPPQRYFAANLERLNTIRRSYDPAGLMSPITW